jgi:hypothetical protein
MRDCLPLLNSGKVELLDHSRLISQFLSLERRTSRGTGRDIIDHPPSAHDGVANAVCGAALSANGRAGAFKILDSLLAYSRKPQTMYQRRIG